MAIIKCRECGKEISEEAMECPYCGGATEKKKKIVNQSKEYIQLIIGAIIGAIIIFTIGPLVVEKMEQAAYMRSQKALHEIIENIEIYDPDE